MTGDDNAASPDIPGAARVVDLIGRWRTSDIAFVHSVVFRVHEQLELTNELVLGLIACRRESRHSSWPTADVPWFLLQLRCVAVRDLVLRINGTGLVQVMGFSIVDVTDRGWEAVHYQVFDDESGQLSFLCDSLEITDVRPCAGEGWKQRW